MHKTSFKLGKPKPSKVRMLTKSELIGIASSAVLSILISILLVYIGIKGSPIVLNNLKNFFYDIIGEAPKGSSQVGATLNKANVLALQRNATVAHFTSKYYGKAPVVFDFTVPKEKIIDRFENLQASLVSDNTNVLLRSTSKFDRETKEVAVSKLLSGRDFSLESGKDYIGEVELTQVCRVDSCSWSSESSSPILQEFRDKVTLVIGRNITGLIGPGFRSDRQFVSELLHGSKRWFIYKPNKIPSAGIPVDKSPRRWLDTSYPLLSLSDMPMEIYQKAGQLVYVPEGWYHATVTVSESSVSLQRYTTQEDRNSYYHYLRVGLSRFNEGDFTGANKMFKLGLALCRDAQLLYFFALSLEKAGLLSQARDALYEMVTKNKSDPTGYVQLIKLLVTHFSDSDSSADTKEPGDSGVTVAVLLEMAEQNHIRDVVLQHCQDSL